MSIGRSACRNVPIATSTATSAARRSTKRAMSRRSRPKSPIARRSRQGRTVRSVFFGGGTPSLMRPGRSQGVIDAIGAAWRLDPDAEITLEANPTSVEADAVSRLSRRRRQPRVDRRPGAERRRPQGARAPAHRRRGAGRGRGSPARSFRASLRPDLRPAWAGRRRHGAASSRKRSSASATTSRSIS